MNSESDGQTTTTNTNVAREGVAYIEKHGAGWKLVFKQLGSRHGRVQFPKISFIKSGPEKLGALADGKLDVESSVVSQQVQDEIKPNLNPDNRILKSKSSGNHFSTIVNDIAATDNRSKTSTTFKTFQPSKKVKRTDYPKSDVQSDPLETSSIDMVQYTFPASLESHAPEEPFVQSTQAVNPKLYTCLICQSSFSKLNFFKYHLKTHEKAETTFHCTICTKSFPDQLKLTSHNNYHRLENCFKCKLCDKSFTFALNLKVHMRSHTGERPYNCHFCGKPFSQLGNLNVHLKIHTGERPHQCSLCEKSFFRLADLRLHSKSRAHTGHSPNSFIELTDLQAKTAAAAYREPHSGHAKETQALPQGKTVMKRAKADLDQTESEIVQRSDSTNLTDGAKIRKIQTRDTRAKPFRCSTCFKSFIRSEHFIQHTKTHLLD